MNLRVRLLMLLIVAGNLFSPAAIAQNGTISGYVKDINGEPVAGATIVVNDSYLGTASDYRGFFSLTGVKNGTVSLSVSFVGYRKEVVKTESSGRDLQITLHEETYTTNEVVIRGIRAGSKTPVAQTNIDREYLNEVSNGQDMPFLLALTPSLVETSEAGNGIGYTAFRIRGSDGSRINVTIDGIPLNDAESQQVFWVDLPDLVSSVSSIQIQRGVGTSTNGAGAFGASVNIQTETPSAEPSASITAGFGSFNTFRSSVEAATGIISKRLSLNMRYSAVTTDGYVDYSGSDHSSMHVSALLQRDRSRLKGSILIGKERTGISWWGVPAEIVKSNPRFNPAGQYTDEQGVDRYYEDETDNYLQNHYNLTWSGQVTPEMLLNISGHLTTGKGYYEQRKEDRSLSGYGLPDLPGPVTESDLVERKWLDNIFGGLTWSLNYDPGKTTLIWGGSVNNYSGDHFGRIIWMQHPGAIEKDYQWYLNNGSKQEFNTFLKAESDLSGGLRVYGDIQYRHIGYSIHGTDDELRNMSEDLSYNFINPKAGAFLTINNRNEIYGSFSVAGREPSRANITDAIGDDEATPGHETLFDTEIGYNYKGALLSLNINLFNMQYNNQLVPTGELSNVGYPIMTNVKDSYRRGIEVVYSILPFPEIEVNGSITLSRNRIIGFTEYYTNYNTTDWSSEYLAKPARDVDIAYSPKITAMGEIKFQPWEKTGISLSGKYVGRQYFDNTNSSERQLDPYFVSNLRFDFRPTVRFAKEIGFQLLINNIFNTFYISNGYGGNWYEDGIEQTWAYLFPQAGINYMVRVNFNF